MTDCDQPGLVRRSTALAHSLLVTTPSVISSLACFVGLAFLHVHLHLNLLTRAEGSNMPSVPSLCCMMPCACSTVSSHVGACSVTTVHVLCLLLKLVCSIERIHHAVSWSLFTGCCCLLSPWIGTSFCACSCLDQQVFESTKTSVAGPCCGSACFVSDAQRWWMRKAPLLIVTLLPGVVISATDLACQNVLPP